MNSAPLVNFRGDWSSSEKDLVEAAVAHAEAVGLPSCADDTKAPWMAIRTVLENKRLYAASRLHIENGILGRSASGLAERIRRFGEQHADVPTGEGDRPLFQLAYKSAASDALTEDGLKEILRQARSNNDDLDVTGLLLYAQGEFFQVLEGPESAVRDLYDTIRQDPRHSHIETLHSTQVAERTFPEWKMALDNLAVVAEEEGVSPFLQTGDLAAVSPPENGLMNAIERFRRAALAEEHISEQPLDAPFEASGT